MSLFAPFAAILGAPSVLLALVLSAVTLLELERRWTRACRFAGMHPGTPAFVLDGLAILAVLLAVMGVVLALTQAIVSALQSAVNRVSSLPWQIDGTAAGLTLGAAIALVALIVLIRRMTVRFPSTIPPTERAAVNVLPLAASRATHLPPAAASAAAPALPPPSDFEEEPQLVMLRTRQTRPRAASVPEHPEPHSAVQPETKPSTQRAHRGVIVIVVLLLAAGAAGVVYRDALLPVLSGFATTQGGAIIALSSSVDVPAPSPIPTVSATVAPPSALPVMQVAAGRLNLRAGPGTDYPVLTTLSRGDEVEYLGETAGSGENVWMRVRAGTQEGWVFRAFLRDPTFPSP